VAGAAAEVGPFRLIGGGRWDGAGVEAVAVVAVVGVALAVSAGVAARSRQPQSHVIVSRIPPSCFVRRRMLADLVNERRP
jgi:hypothetical protein